MKKTWCLLLSIILLMNTSAYGFSHKKNSVSISHFPILMYHTSSEKHPGKLADLFVKPSEFEKQMKLLLEKGYTPVTFEDFPLRDDIKKPIMITFDDGYEANYIDIFPILKKYHVRATIFVVTNPIGRPKRLTADEIMEMSRSGFVSIQSHTVSHRNLKLLSGKDLENELGKSKDILERLTGKRVLALAYPNGDYGKNQIMIYEKYYRYGLRKDGGFYREDDSKFEIRRHRISRKTSISDFEKMIGTP